MFRGNAAHSGVYSSSPAPSIGSVKWKFKTRGQIFSSPAIADGVVYVGSTDWRLYAVNAADGAVKWNFPTNAPVNSSPAVFEGAVYFSSIDGSFYAVNVADGKQKWKFDTEGERRFTAPGIHGLMPRTELMPDPFDVFLSSPVIAHGVVYFGSGDKNVYALDARTGAVKWKFATGDVVHATPAIADGVVYIGSWDRNLYALDASTGAVRWKFQTGDDKQIYNQIGIASSASVANGVVYFGCRDGHLYAVDAKTGQQKWSHDNHTGWVIASPAVHEGIVYFPTAEGARFKALKADTGAEVFNIVNENLSFSSPAIAGTTAYYGTTDGLLHAVDIQTGKQLAEFKTEGHKENSAKYLDDKGKFNQRALFVNVTLDGAIISQSRLYSLGSILSSPAVDGGVLYVGSTDGYLYALN